MVCVDLLPTPRGEGETSLGSPSLHVQLIPTFLS